MARALVPVVTAFVVVIVTGAVGCEPSPPSAERDGPAFPNEGEGEGEGDVVEPLNPELCGGSVDVDGDGAAGCGDSDCARDYRCAIGSASCVAPETAPTHDAMRARFADAVHPLLARQQQGCVRCHGADSPRAFRVDESDANASFDNVVAGRWLDLDDELAVPARVFRDNMPKASPPWSDDEKNLLRSFACDLHFVDGGDVEVPTELDCLDGDDDADGLADCADPDCAGALACVDVPDGCTPPTTLPTRDSINARYLSDIDPMMRAADGGCTTCHRATSFREMKLENDPQITFDVLFSQGWFDLANPDAIPEKIFTDEMPRNAAPWTAEQKATLHAFACDASLVPTGPVIEPPAHETNCLDGDDDGDALADCADPDCASQIVCQPPPAVTCTPPAVAPTLQSLEARFAADLDPLLRTSAKNCLGCHREDGSRSMRLRGDAASTFAALRSEGWLALDNPNGIVARVLPNNMPRMRDAWSDAEKALLTSFACDLSVAVDDPVDPVDPVDPPVSDDEGDASAPDAVTLPLDHTIDIAAGGDVDCFALTLPEASRLVVNIDDGTGFCDGTFDTFVTVYERTFAFIAADDDNATGDLCGDLDVELGAGSYTVCVEEYTLALALDAVEIEMSATGLAGTDDDVLNVAHPTAASLPFDRTTSIAPALDSDCFALAMPAGRSYLWTSGSGAGLAGEACPGDTLLELFAGAQRVANDDGGDGACSLLVVDVDEDDLDVTLCASTRGAPTGVGALLDDVRVRARSGRDGLMIAAVDYDTPGTDVDEAVVITNTGPVAAPMGGVHLASVNGNNGALIKAIDLSAVGSLAPGATVVVAQNPASFADGNLVIPAGSTSFLQNGGTTGDGVMLVSTVSGTVIDAVSWDGAVNVNNLAIGGVAFTASLVEGTSTQLRDTDAAGGALCRRFVDDATEMFAGAMDTNDAASDLTRCSF